MQCACMQAAELARSAACAALLVMRSSHSHTPFTLTIDQSRAAVVSVDAVPPVPLDDEWAANARRPAARAVASAAAQADRRRREPPLRTLQPPRLSFTERSLPGDHSPRKERSGALSARSSGIRELAARELRRRNGLSSSQAAAVVRSSSQPRRSRATAPPTAVYVPVGEMTSPIRAHLHGSNAPIITSPLRQQYTSTSAQSPQLQIGSPPRGALAPALSSSASSPFRSSGSAVVAASDESGAALPLGSPKISWSLEQWKEWADSSVPAKPAPPVRTGAASEQLLYPASVLLTPPRGQTMAAARSALATPEPSPFPAAALAQSAGFSFAAQASSVAALVQPPSLSASFAAPAFASSLVSSPRSAVVGLASPPPSTLQSIALLAVRNLHARILKARAFEGWRMQFKHQEKLNRMVSKLAIVSLASKP